METNMNELKTLQEEEKSSIVGGIVMVCGNVYNENKKEITKEVGDYILYVVEQERQKSNTLGMMKGVEMVEGVVARERDTWAKESIGDKALQSLEMALVKLKQELK